MPHAEFFKLVQLVDANRKVQGQDAMGITDADVAEAERADNREASHLPAMGEAAHEVLTCPECAVIRVLRSAQRETLHSRGIDFPMDVFVESPMTLHNPEVVRVTDSMDSSQRTSEHLSRHLQ